MFFFKYGTKFNKNNTIVLNISKIYGINLRNSFKICKKLGFTAKLITMDLTVNDWLLLDRFIKKNTYINTNLVNFRKTNLIDIINIRSYKSMRHKSLLPVRGQRTHSNRKTQRKIGKMHLALIQKSFFSLLITPIFKKLNTIFLAGRIRRKKKKKRNKAVSLKKLKYLSLFRRIFRGRHVPMRERRYRYTNHIYVHFKPTNIIIYVYNSFFKLVFWSSGGCLGFKGRHRSSASAVDLLVLQMIRKLKKLKMMCFRVTIKGRKTPLRRYLLSKLKVKKFFFKRLTFLSGRSHNGCRLKKRKR